MIILSIDPGSTNLGWAVLEKDNNKITLLDYGTFTPRLGLVDGLNAMVYERIFMFSKDLITKWVPDEIISEKFNIRRGLRNAGVVPNVIHTIRLTAILYACTELILYPVATWRTTLFGIVSLEKDQVVSKIQKLGYKLNDTVTHDAYEAVAIGLAFFKINNSTFAPTAPRKRKVKKRRKRKYKKRVTKKKST